LSGRSGMLRRELTDLAADLDAGFDREAEMEACQHTRFGVFELALRPRY
jgi:hypothetical protein